MKNRTPGSILIVTGTTIGAGMLAMPLAAISAGFAVTLGLLFILWALMCYTALLLLEICQHVPTNMEFGSPTARYPGRYGRWVTRFCMLSLLCALMAAYISDAGELLAFSLNQWLDWQLPPTTDVLLFTVLGGTVVRIGTSLVDLFSRFLFNAKIIFLTIMLALLMPHIHQVNLLMLPVEQGLVLSAIPMIFTSFGFHGSISSIVSYFGGNIRKLCRIFTIDSFIPLVAYIFWQLATLGSINLPIFTALLAENAGLNDLLEAAREVMASLHVELTVRLFTNLVLTTSFLSVSLDLLDYLADVLQRKNSVSGRLRSGAIIFLPPVAFALFRPRGFVTALSYVGAALAVLALMLSVLLAIKSRRQHPQAAWWVVGGTPVLWLVLPCGIGIVAVQLSVVAGLLSAVR